MERESETPNGWLFDPVSNCVEYLVDEMIILSLSERGVIVLTGLPKLLETIGRLSGENIMAIEHVRRFYETSIGDAKLATEQLTRGLQASLSHACVGFWSAIESAVEELLLNHIIRIPDATELISQNYPKLRPPDIRDRDSIRYYIRRWEHQTDKPDVVQRMYQMLNLFHLGFDLVDKHERKLIELCEYRNIALHRQGRVDASFLRKVPWCELSEGTRYALNREGLLQFHEACGEFCGALFGRIAQSPWIYRAPPPSPAASPK